MKKRIFHTPNIFNFEAKEKDLILKGYKLIEEGRETHNLKPFEYLKFTIYHKNNKKYIINYASDLCPIFKYQNKPYRQLR